MSADDAFMAQALALAARGRGGVSPNPMVGAVLVKDGVVVGQGWHQRAGGPHAEIHALAMAGEAARGATMVVTLEPCCHVGRTGPCTQAVIAAGVARVVVAADDPNPRVAGRGLAELRAAGIAVLAGLMAPEARRLNRAFAHWIQTGTPWVVVKLAQSVDGRIARTQGTSHAVTDAAARVRVHGLRAAADLVLVGSNTALIDDPQLTVRQMGEVMPGYRVPRRGVVDSQLRVGPEARMYAPLAVSADAGADGRPLVAAALAVSDPRAEALAAAGVEVLSVPDATGARVDLPALFAALGRLPSGPVTSVLVEGGGELAARLFGNNLVHQLLVHQASCLYGARGVPAVGVLDADTRLTLDAVTRLGDDLELDFSVAP